MCAIVVCSGDSTKLSVKHMFDSIISRRIMKSVAFSFNGSIVLGIKQKKLELETLHISLCLLTCRCSWISHKYRMHRKDFFSLILRIERDTVCRSVIRMRYVYLYVIARTNHFHLPNSNNNLLTVFFFIRLFPSLSLWVFVSILKQGIVNSQIQNSPDKSFKRIQKICINVYWSSQYVKFKTLCYWTQ